jgi:hypothetical protein
LCAGALAGKWLTGAHVHAADSVRFPVQKVTQSVYRHTPLPVGMRTVCVWRVLQGGACVCRHPSL